LHRRSELFEVSALILRSHISQNAVGIDHDSADPTAAEAVSELSRRVFERNGACSHYNGQ
jgi:hypothetical protein